MKTEPDNHCRCSKCIEQEKETAAAPPFGTLFDGGKPNEQTTPAPIPATDLFKQQKDPFYFKGYWYQEYLKMREKYWARIGENSKLEEQLKVKEFLLNQAIKDLETEQAKNRKLEDQLKVKQRESRELYAMLGHLVDWSPELPFYMKDEYKTLFQNALAAARELLSKCKVKEGK